MRHFFRGHHQYLCSCCEQEWLQLRVHKRPSVYRKGKEIVDGGTSKALSANIKVDILMNG